MLNANFTFDTVFCGQKYHMSPALKQLVTRNKLAFDSKFYIESLSLSYILINKELKELVKKDLPVDALEVKIKTTDLIKIIKKELKENSILKAKLSKKVFNEVIHFNRLYKDVYKELKFQYSEKKIFETAKLGIDCVAMLHTNILKAKHNK